MSIIREHHALVEHGFSLGLSPVSLEHDSGLVQLSLGGNLGFNYAP